MTYLFQDNAASSDAFGRSRTSTPFTLGDYKHIYGIDPNFLEVITNGAAISYAQGRACAQLSVSQAQNSRIVHQSKLYHHYMPGKSQLILSSFNMYNHVDGVYKRTGYFDDDNGIYFQSNAVDVQPGVLQFVIRSKASGGVVAERKVSQANWNKDKCDGTGVSGFNLDLDKTQLVFFDFQWLGVGRVRCGFVHNGEYIIAHEFYNSNVLDRVYMSNPNLPIRCEMINTEYQGPNPNLTYMDQICSTVISEGGYVEAGQDWAHANKPRTLTSGQTLPIMAIRLKNTLRAYPNRSIVRMGNLNLFSSGENIKWQLIKLSGTAQLTETTWTDVDADSGVQYNVDATAYTGGNVLDAGWVGASTQGSQKAGGTPGSNIPSSAKKNYIVQNFDCTDSEIFVVVATNLGTQSTNVGVAMQWREIY
jgi:hypothetical protein